MRAIILGWLLLFLPLSNLWCKLFLFCFCTLFVTFVIYMTRIIKYIILLTVSVTFLNLLEGDRVTHQQIILQENSTESVEISSYITETTSDLCLLRRVSNSNATSVKCNTRRIDKLQRESFELFKSGKTITPKFTYFLRNSLLDSDSSQTNPSFNLVRFGKFVI